MEGGAARGHGGYDRRGACLLSAAARAGHVEGLRARSLGLAARLQPGFLQGARPEQPVGPHLLLYGGGAERAGQDRRGSGEPEAGRTAGSRHGRPAVAKQNLQPAGGHQLHGRRLPDGVALCQGGRGLLSGVEQPEAAGVGLRGAGRGLSSCGENRQRALLLRTVHSAHRVGEQGGAGPRAGQPGRVLQEPGQCAEG